MADPALPPESADEPPPVLGSWPRLYALVAVNLVFLIVLFWLFSKAFQ